MLASIARATAATAALALIAASPASAATKSCGTVQGVGNQISVTKVTTSSGTCVVAKGVAKRFALTRSAPAEYTCRERFTVPLKRAGVTCRRPGRTITFKVAWNGFFPFPAAPAPPSAGGGS